jgi:hypothetical protein
VLPQSITQEAEADQLMRRFGVDALPEGFSATVHGKVQLAQSGGSTGPDRARMGLKVFGLLLLIGGAAGAYYFYVVLGGQLP